jgi:CubicO group peptidase (beta-lactamase class C family)
MNVFSFRAVNKFSRIMISELLVAVFLLSVTSNLFAIETQIKTKSQSKQEFNRLLQELDEIQSRYNIPAYAVVITSPERVLLDEVRGVSYSRSKKPVSTEAYFRIGSITKTFISLSALVAEKQGKLKLSDKVTDYLGKELFKNPYLENNPVTIEQLLEHSAGFPDMDRREFASNDEVTLEQGLQRFAKNRTTLWQPGQFHSYSNLSFGLAGRVIETATQTNINDWLVKSVFKPLGMESATLQHSKIVSANLVPGYQADGVELIPYWNMVYPSLGAINLQPRDMAKLIQFYLKRGAGYLSEKKIQRQESPQTTLAAKQGLTYGYGLGLYQWYRNGRLFFGHGGDADGYLSHFGYQKEAGKGYFVSINTFNNRAKSAMKKVIEKFIVKNLPETVSSEEVSGEDLSRLAGEYLPVTSRFKSARARNPLELKWETNKLLIKEPGQSWEALVYSGNGLFRRTYETNATTAIFSFEGTIWLQGDEGNLIKR